MDSGRFLFDSSGGHGNMLFLGNGESHFRGLRSMLDIEKSLKRPSFYCSSDDLFSDDYYDEQLPEKKRRLTPEQVDLLEKSFEAENKLEPDRKAELSKKLGLQPRQVAVWFQNRRARWKTKQLERDYDHLKSSYDALLSDYDLILKENEKLRTEVSSLNEKLHTKGVDGAPFPDLKPDPIPFVEVSVKMEDHMSSGSGGSSVIDEESPQLVDSGDSYFLEDNDYPEHVGTIDAVHSEDDGTDDGRGYFSDVFVAAEEQQVPSGWWVWS